MKTAKISAGCYLFVQKTQNRIKSLLQIIFKEAERMVALNRRGFMKLKKHTLHQEGKNNQKHFMAT